jgi:hypothetical protein
LNHYSQGAFFPFSFYFSLAAATKKGKEGKGEGKQPTENDKFEPVWSGYSVTIWYFKPTTFS